MVFFCFIENQSGPPLMEWLRSSEAASALSEARALPGPRGQIAHVFDGDIFLETVTTEGRPAGLATGFYDGQAGTSQFEPLSPATPPPVDPVVPRMGTAFVGASGSPEA